MSIILKFKYYGTPCNVKKMQTGDLLRVPNRNRAFQNLMYLASISVLNQPVVHSRNNNFSTSRFSTTLHAFQTVAPQ